MLIKSKYFGELEFTEEKIITFEHGLIAFEQMKRFILIGQDSENSLWWLHSVEDPELAFVVINPFIFKPDYKFELTPEDVEELEIQNQEEVVILAIVVVPEEVKKMTANLLAPVIFNARLKKGKQIVLQDKEYTTRHFIMEELQKTQKAEKAEQGSKIQEAKQDSSKGVHSHASTNQKKR
jgi:flagellar assembly factor FliW